MNRELLSPVPISYLHSNQLDLEFDRGWIEFWFAQVMFTFLERKVFKSALKTVCSHTLKNQSHKCCVTSHDVAASSTAHRNYLGCMQPSMCSAVDTPKCHIQHYQHNLGNTGRGTSLENTWTLTAAQITALCS